MFFLCLCFLTQIKADNCSNTPQKCGNLVIPYPFQIAGNGKNCGLSGFEIHCKNNASFNTTQFFPFLQTPSGDVQILNFSDNHVLVNSSQFYASSCEPGQDLTEVGIPEGGPFRISVNNTFVTVGCRSLGMVGMYQNPNDILWGGCVSVCDNTPTLSDCNGNGCCQTLVPENFNQYVLSAQNINITRKNNSGMCTYSAVIDQQWWSSVSKKSIKDFRAAVYYMRLDWAIPNDTCASAMNKTSFQCAAKTECKDQEWGYVCNCKSGFSGDGYLNGTGCTDIDECSNPDLNKCYPSSKGGRCQNTDGSYTCSCAKGHGDGYKIGTRCTRTNFQTLSASIGVGATLVVVVFGGVALFWIRKQRKSWLAKHRNFRRNGGNRLQSLVSSLGEAARIFSLDEIEKATNKFAESLVLGSGGYGTVYKGTFSDGSVMAIKKSKAFEVDSKEVDQFINEVVILSQINHRNIVKLLGFCLETPVPLLVYEYISNGTISDHLYGDKCQQNLQWEDRLRIVTETAEALSYLHSSASIPIVHRDVKSSNILLDHGLTPKVADFGVSRLVPMDQTHITTVVQGTLGYLDPEYFQTVQLTEKSDVYSFGVVMAELLTGLKPVSYERMKNDSNLAICFLSKMKTQDLDEILDSRLNLQDSRIVESMQKVAMLAKECLSVEGEKRPTMKEVVQELLWIRGGGRAHAWSDGNAAGNEEDMISLIIEEEERSDGGLLSRTTGEQSMLQSTTYSFGIEGFKDSLRRGR